MTRSKTRFALLGAAAALALTLTACGGDDDGGDNANADGGNSGDYCEEVKTFGEDFASAMQSQDQEAAGDMAESFQKIADAAPDDIKADWQTMVDALKTLQDIDVTDPKSAEKLEELGDLQAVNTRITEHMQEECGAS